MVSFFTIFYSCLLYQIVIASPSWPGGTLRHWHGWSNVKYLFLFGDSYTTVGFNASTGPQPSASNPFGNPLYPGYTSSDGPNWADFLTTTYNQSLILTYDLAFGGATIDDAIIKGSPNTVSLKSQVEEEYLTTYASKPHFPTWSADDSLFALFIGINDINNGYEDSDAVKLTDEDWAEYAVLVDEVYRSGAKNFLFLNVPPIDRSPGTLEAGPIAEVRQRAAIAAWNQRLTAFASNLTQVYGDTTAFMFDTNEVFSQILDNPSTYPQTTELRDVTGYCFAYENGTATSDTYIPGCLYPVNDYFWLNTLHPTYPVHNATASQIAKQLGGSGYAHGEPWGWSNGGSHLVPATWTPWGVHWHRR